MPTQRSISQMRYDKEKSRHYGIKLNRRTDEELIAMLDAQPSYQAYLKRLIRADIELHGLPRPEEPEE